MATNASPVKTGKLHKVVNVINIAAPPEPEIRATAENPRDQLPVVPPDIQALLPPWLKNAVIEEIVLTAPAIPASPDWDEAVLREVEAHLIRFIGPIAKAIVRLEAKQTTDLDELYVRLSQKLELEERPVFMGMRHQLIDTVRPQASANPVPQTFAVPLSREAITTAERNLNTYIGPIAKVVVKSALARARSSSEFYRMLADRIQSKTDRARFLSTRGD